MTEGTTQEHRKRTVPRSHRGQLVCRAGRRGCACPDGDRTRGRRRRDPKSAPPCRCRLGTRGPRADERRSG